MDFKEQFVREVFENYFSRAISRILPIAIKNALKEPDVLRRQEYISLKKAILAYDISRRTLYNYHNKGYITLCSSEGRTYISVFELEEYIRKHPIPRNP